LVERLTPTSSRADVRLAMTYVTVLAELIGRLILGSSG
jgi:hypothetical protein